MARAIWVRTVGIAAVASLAILGIPAQAGAATTIIVRPGQSIQAAVDQAAPGDTILVEPGTYTEPGVPCPTDGTETCAVAITKDRIRLIGRSGKNHPVVLQSPGGQDQGIEVATTGDPSCLGDPSERVQGSLIAGFTVTGFDRDGVVLFCADGWRVTMVRTTDNAEYGIFPSHWGAGRIDHSFASGANNTGIYVGQSHGVRIDHNTAVGNVSGFEIENSSDVRADHNEASGNTGGILSFTLPFLDVASNSHNRIDHNLVVDNNKLNTCPPGDDVCNVPVGTGIAVVAADDNQVDHNRVSANDSFGIAVVNVCDAFHLPPAVCGALDIDPSSDGDHIVFNEVTGNGASPDPSIAPLPGTDLLWDATGTGNCWEKNVAATSFPAPLPTCG